MVTFTQKISGCHEALDSPPPKPSGLPVVLVAAAALIDTDGRILMAQRPEGKNMAGLWEFPGGKVDDGEVPEYALMRELREELAIETRPGCFFPVAFASHSYKRFHLLMPLFTCRVWDGTPRPQEGQAIKWLAPQTLYDLDMPEADIPLIDQLVQFV
jgi:8-oxo-dGTP diphosphatase